MPFLFLGLKWFLSKEYSQYYGRSRQFSRPVGVRCSMGLGRNPLIDGLFQHTFKFNFLLVEKFTEIPFD